MSRFEKFTETEIARIQDAFWPVKIFRELGKGEVPCPKCGAQCDVLLGQTTGYPRTVDATCRVCGTRSQFRATPEKGRDLDDYEKKYFVGRHQGGLESACPTCHTPLDIEEHAALGGGLSYTLRCKRCGAAGKLQWKSRSPAE